ncbi:MAG: hypothetical protein NT004_10655 [Bacteroidetes bacterium]|nr:hypothetical protein [Bacteroidota bacterium]
MKRIQKLIPSAIEAVKEKKLLKKDKTDGIERIDREFNGYISSFGASIISAGLLPSIIFYSQKGDSASDRHLVINCIEFILQRQYGLTGSLLEKVRVLFTTASNRAEISRWTDNISDAAVALKLAIRIFPKTQKARP